MDDDLSEYLNISVRDSGKLIRKRKVEIKVWLNAFITSMIPCDKGSEKIYSVLFLPKVAGRVNERQVEICQTDLYLPECASGCTSSIWLQRAAHAFGIKYYVNDDGSG